MVAVAAVEAGSGIQRTMVVSRCCAMEWAMYVALERDMGILGPLAVVRQGEDWGVLDG